MNGQEISEEQIDQWVAEAEAGYDYVAMKKRGRGRPGRGAVASQVIALRLTKEEVERLDARVKEEGTTRSEVIREALHLASA